MDGPICAHHDGLARFIPSNFLTHMSGSQIWINFEVDPNLSSRHVCNFSFQLSLLIFFTLNFFRFNMFIWRSIMSYVNAVLIKISVLNSTMTTASTSKFIFHFILYIYDHSQTFLSIRCSQMRTLQNQVVSKSPIVL